jgi:TRAP-type C4-dicarboxylate transport system permease small subunit
MSEFGQGIGTIISALIEGDSWGISEALRHQDGYIVGIALVILGGLLLMKILQWSPLLDRHLERTILVSTYLAIGGIIFVEVIRRFTINEQVPWSTTLPPVLFLVMTWVGCAYNVRLRAHLSFSELRTNLPRIGQMACLYLDAILWLVFSVIVVVTTLRQTANSASNFQILLGTDNVMQWWFYICVPLSWILLSARVFENLFQDIARYKSDEPLIQQVAIGGGE